MSRFYDERLAEAEVTVTQFAILRRAGMHGRVAQNRLAEEMVMERTSLYRAIEPLKRRRLVRLRPGTDRRQKDLELTAAGRRTWRRAERVWERTQRDFIEAYGPGAWEKLAGLLSAIHEGLAVLATGPSPSRPRPRFV
jgi:DNA-binding MarR family transcriptional regulator